MKKMGVGNREECKICMAWRWWTMSKKLANRSVEVLCAGLAVLGFACVLWAQSSSTQPSPAQQNAPPSNDQPQDQNIPDAPSTVQPPKPAPENPPPQEQVPPEAAPEQPQAPPPANEPAPRQSVPADQAQKPSVKPPINIRTVPEGGATKQAPGSPEELPTIIVRTNHVMVPVTVKDESGRLGDGLLDKDFTVKENGKKQALNYFTSDQFALTVAVILDLGMKDVDVQRVNHTFPALEGAFSG